MKQKGAPSTQKAMLDQPYSATLGKPRRGQGEHRHNQPKSRTSPRHRGETPCSAVVTRVAAGVSRAGAVAHRPGGLALVPASLIVQVVTLAPLRRTAVSSSGCRVKPSAGRGRHSRR
jgi:hypothetical protein